MNRRGKEERDSVRQLLFVERAANGISQEAGRTIAPGESQSLARLAFHPRLFAK